MLLSCREDSIKSEKIIWPQDTIIVSGSQDDSPKAIPQIKTREDIKSEHSYISEMAESGNLISTSFKYNCNEEKKGELKYFFENNKLRLIKHTYNEYSHFSATDEYYIKDGSVFFVFLNHVSWNFTEHNQTRDNITESRIYILENKAVRCLEKKYSVHSNDKNPPESNEIPNKEIECNAVEATFKDFEMLYKLREQKEDMGCLEE